MCACYFYTVLYRAFGIYLVVQLSTTVAIYMIYVIFSRGFSRLQILRVLTNNLIPCFVFFTFFVGLLFHIIIIIIPRRINC